MTSKFNGWPRKITGHLFCALSSSVHYFKAINEFKLELHPGNTRFGSKSAFFVSCLNLKFDRCPLKTIGHLLYVTSRFVRHFIAIGQIKLELQSRNVQSVSKSAFFCPVRPRNPTPHPPTPHPPPPPAAIYEFKLYLLSGNGQIGSKSVILLSHVILKFGNWHWKTTMKFDG